MVEAAVVFPIVVLTLMLLIYGMLYLYNETAAGASVRRAVLREAGRSAGTYSLVSASSPDTAASGSVYRIRPCAAGEKTVRFQSRMPGVKNRERTIAAHQYIYNEKTEIRLFDVFRE